MTQSRRDFLSRAGGVFAGVAAGPVGTSPWLATTELTVATQNLGLGVRLFDLPSAESVDPAVVHERLEQLRRNEPTVRMEAIAGELASRSPAVVGVQEAAVVRRDGDLVADFLPDLLAGLEDSGVDYRVAARVSNADVSFPGVGPDGEYTLRYADHDALLVRGDVPVERAGAANYGVNASTVVDGERITATRGYCLAEVRVNGVPMTTVSTHLASADGRIRRAQAAELREGLPESGPVALLADLNSTPDDPDPSAYGILTERLADAWMVADREGATCCQLPGLWNEQSRLWSRIDHVLVDGPATPLSASRLLADPSVRVTVDGRTLWPSDHAGVVARLRAGPSLWEPRAVLDSVLARFAGATNESAQRESGMTGAGDRRI